MKFYALYYLAIQGKYLAKGITRYARNTFRPHHFLLSTSTIFDDSTPWNVKIGTGTLLLVCGKTTRPILNRIFLPEALIHPLQRLFSLKESRSSVSWRNHRVYARNQGLKRKEFGMEENGDVFVFASRIVTNAPSEQKLCLELRNAPINTML